MDRKAEARAATNRSDYPTAYLLWKELAQEVGDADSLLQYGWASYKLELWQEAQVALEQSLGLDAAKGAVAMEMLGHLWFARTDEPMPESEQLHRSEFWLRQAIANGRSAQLFTTLGAVYARLEAVTQAIEAFETALTLDSSYEEAMYNLAVLLEDTDPLRAVSLLESAIEIDPDYLLAHLELGKHRQRQQDAVGAEFHFRRSMELDPADYWTYLYLANTLAVQGKDEEAEGLYQFAIRLAPERQDCLNIFASFLESIGKPQKAAAVRFGRLTPDASNEDAS